MRYFHVIIRVVELGARYSYMINRGVELGARYFHRLYKKYWTQYFPVAIHCTVSIINMYRLYKKYCSQYSPAALQSWLQQEDDWASLARQSVIESYATGRIETRLSALVREVDLKKIAVRPLTMSWVEGKRKSTAKLVGEGVYYWRCVRYKKNCSRKKYTTSD